MSLFVLLSSLPVPIDTMMFASADGDGSVISEYEDGMTVPFSEGAEHHFVCEASGSNPAPALTMTLGDEDIS